MTIKLNSSSNESIVEAQALNQKGMGSRYRFIPYTLKNIGKNYLKRFFTSKTYKPEETGKRERERNLKNHLTMSAVKVTPRKEGDFEGKAWHRLHKHLKQIKQIKKEAA